MEAVTPDVGIFRAYHGIVKRKSREGNTLQHRLASLPDPVPTKPAKLPGRPL